MEDDVTSEEAHRQLDHVRGALLARYRGVVPDSDVAEVVERVAQRFLAAPVRDYVGILTERAARVELDRRHRPAAAA
ncbi:MAG: hypothetical protein R2761_25840 [Acidimicrobiales bacterium]